MIVRSFSLPVPPVVRRVKRDLRDVYWLLRGGSRSESGVARPVRSILFVCKGNICRSPFAAEWARKLVDEAGVESVRIASAGLQVKAGMSPENAIVAAEACGLDLRTHVPRQLTPELTAEFDLIVAMEPWHRDAVRRIAGAAARCALLATFDPATDGWRSCAYARYHVDDPYGGELERFERCFSRIQRCVARLVSEVGPMGAAGAIRS